MKWQKKPFSHHLILEEGDNGYSGVLKKNETNIFAMIYQHRRSRRTADMRIFSIKKSSYKLFIADLEGQLYFKRLKDAKEFAEKTYTWMFKKYTEDKEAEEVKNSCPRCQGTDPGCPHVFIESY
jgi:hypothetical protein